MDQPFGEMIVSGVFGKEFRALGRLWELTSSAFMRDKTDRQQRR